VAIERFLKPLTRAGATWLTMTTLPWGVSHDADLAKIKRAYRIIVRSIKPAIPYPFHIDILSDMVAYSIAE
jgi:hypothetical protein